MPCADLLHQGIGLELELLLCCARTRVSPETATHIRTLVSGRVDWACLLRLARHHGVVPPLHTSLSSVCSDVVPEDFTSQLASYAHKIALRNLTLTGTLLHLLDRLRSQAVQAIPYKGPVLAMSAYGDIGLRQFDDLDVLIRRHDLSRAMDVLASEGYCFPLGLTRDRTIAFSDSESHFTLFRDNTKVVLELHWGVLPRYFAAASRMGGIWGRLTPVRILDTEVLTVSTHDLLLIACVRGSRQFWDRLSWLCDIAEMTREWGREEWETAMGEAERRGMRRAVFLGLFLAKDLLGVRLPEGVLREVSADPTVRRLAVQTVKRMVAEDREDASGRERLFFHLVLRERLADKIQYCQRRGLAPTQSDWAFLPVSVLPYAAYYLLRPIRLASAYGLNPLRVTGGIARSAKNQKGPL